MQKFKSVEQLVNQLKPDKPVYCIRKNSILSAAKFFQKKFPASKNEKLEIRTCCNNVVQLGQFAIIHWGKSFACIALRTDHGLVFDSIVKDLEKTERDGKTERERVGFGR